MSIPETDASRPKYMERGLTLVFALVFVGSAAALATGTSNATQVVTVVVVSAGVLVLLQAMPRVREFSLGLKGVDAKMDELQTSQDRTQVQVARQQQAVEELQRVINNLVQYSTSASVFRHLAGIAVLKEYVYHDNDTNRRELYFLRDSGLIAPVDSSFLDFDAAKDNRNLSQLAQATPVGRDLVRLRHTEIPSGWFEDPTKVEWDPRKG